MSDRHNEGPPVLPCNGKGLKKGSEKGNVGNRSNYAIILITLKPKGWKLGWRTLHSSAGAAVVFIQPTLLEKLCIVPDCTTFFLALK
jgi:hypothetical protein